MKAEIHRRQYSMKTEQTKTFRSCLHNATLTMVAAAMLASPMVSRADTIYVSNDSDTTISKFTSAGVGSVFANGLNIPHGLALDSAGNLYVANYGDSTIMRFTPG